MATQESGQKAQKLISVQLSGADKACRGAMGQGQIGKEIKKGHSKQLASPYFQRSPVKLFLSVIFPLMVENK